MSKMNIEEKEQLLKDMAANVGYDLIQNPFGTPFAEKSIENLPDCKQFFWTVPASVLNSKEHEEFRKMCIEADIIDTVCTTSLTWPTDDNNHVAILLLDVARRRRGSIKFVDASDWDISNETGMATVCNMLVHDLFPGESHLAFQMDVDVMDEMVDNRWNEHVCIYATCDIQSLNPCDYLHKIGFDETKMCLISDVFDIHYPIVDKDIANLNKTAILISIKGKLSPQIVEPGILTHDITSDDKMLLVPEDGYHVDFDSALQLFKKEETLRQLPITHRITLNDIWRVQIEKSGWFTESFDASKNLLRDL